MRLWTANLSRLLIPLLFVSQPLIPAIGLAEDRDAVQSGELIQEQDEKKAQTFPLTQEKTIEYFKVLQNSIEQSAAGAVPAASSGLDENSLIYLNSAYLYCTINSGTCPSLLDALLEVDLINSKLENQVKCPNLKAFWKLWLRNDMEARLRYSVKTGFLSDTENFKKTERPKYIRCEDTIQKAIEGSGDAAGYFKARYAGDSAPKKAAQRAVKILSEIKDRVPNVIVAVGAR